MTRTNQLPRLKVAFAAVALMAVSFGAVGTSVSAASANQNSSNSSVAQNNNESQAASDLRAGLKSLLQDHVRTNLDVNRLIADKASEAELASAIDAQEANSIALAGAIGSIYGETAGSQFLFLFEEHIDASNEFATAIAEGDTMAQIAAEEELEEYLVDLTEFLVPATGLPADAILGLLREHETLINRSTEAFANENFGQSRKVEVQARKQVAIIADALATGIIATKNL